MDNPTFVDGWFLPTDALNEPMRAGMAALVAHAKRARWTNATVRKDGIETNYEADWIKHLVPFGSAQADAAIAAAATCKPPLQVEAGRTPVDAAPGEPGNCTFCGQRQGHAEGCMWATLTTPQAVGEPVLECSAEDIVAEHGKGFQTGFEAGREYEREQLAAPVAPRAGEGVARVVFPTMLCKMWSGGLVQRWLDENVNKAREG